LKGKNDTRNSLLLKGILNEMELYEKNF